MRKQFIFTLLIFLTTILLTTMASAHTGGHVGQANNETREWTNLATGERFTGAYLLMREGKIHIEDEQGRIVTLPLNQLTESDQQYAEQRLNQIRQLNAQFALRADAAPAQNGWLSFGILSIACLLLSLALLAKARGIGVQRAAVCGVILYLGLAAVGWRQQARQQAQSGRPAMASAFDKYGPRVKTRWDEKFLYVESDGLPDHPMMIGIRAWQQQVPLPQPYTGNNAWQIPLRPVLAQQPVSARTALFRGAIALAVNGVPIFNALNNRGADSYAIGELDEWGGHCGRADDYHYHVAPLHIQQKVGTAQPIAYALDGFPLYGLNEPDGKPARPLDEFNGHADKADTYHYHSTKIYPYINGGMRGVVTVRDDQVDPQPGASPVRQYTQPLRGATITDFKAIGKNHWQLKYQLQGKTNEVDYGLSDDGKADFTFVDSSGKSVTESYRRRDANRRPGPPPFNGDDRRPQQRRPPDDANGQPPLPPNDDGRQPRRNPDDANQPRRPWIIVHARELDTNNDGTVTMQEIITEVNATFAAFDRNTDGKLSAEEFGEARGIRRVLAGFVTQHSKEIDANADGIITKDELIAVCKRMFSRADRNNDGKLTANELAAER